MTLLNGILALGAVAAAIPLLIHLLNRSRFRTVPWGAMHLLESVIRTNNRRIRLEQLLLLLVRCAIPAVLALCLARPVLTGWRALPGEPGHGRRLDPAATPKAPVSHLREKPGHEGVYTLHGRELSLIHLFRHDGLDVDNYDSPTDSSQLQQPHPLNPPGCITLKTYFLSYRTKIS